MDVPDAALELYEAALSSVCDAVGFFPNQTTGYWRVEGVKPVGENEPQLLSVLAIAASMSGIAVSISRTPTIAEGWLARSYAAFPEQIIGSRFAILGSHLRKPPRRGRITLILDAGLAFGSGEHGSTRGCLRALERVARRRPHRVLDLGTGSGILAMAAASLLRRHVLATDLDPWSIRVARRNASLNRLGNLIRVCHADGWRHRAVQQNGPYDLVFANILARPLCKMARQLARHLAPGGTAVLSGLLNNQARAVLAAHLRCGIYLEANLQDGPWTTLIVRRGQS